MFPKYELRNTAIFVANQKKVNKYPARFHKQVEIMLVKENNLEVTIDGEDYVLNPGDIYIVFPNILHSVNNDNSKAMLIIADDDYFISYHDVLSHYRPEVPVLRKGEFPEIIYTLIDRTNAVRLSSFSQRGNTLAGYIAAILGELINCLTLKERSADSDLVQRLILYLLDNYTKEITLDNIASDLNYNKYYISHIISETFKCNFRVLVNSYRISMAQNLLLSSDKTISEIAYECGFKNQSSFNRIFLKHCNITPSNYRKTPEEIPEKPTIYEKVIDNATGRCYNFPVKSKDEEK